MRIPLSLYVVTLAIIRMNVSSCAVNSSRASQTLKANNKALAQSLQRVKQELRLALNENGRLMVENQELSIRLRRLENQVGCGQEQVSYEVSVSLVVELCVICLCVCLGETQTN